MTVKGWQRDEGDKKGDKKVTRDVTRDDTRDDTRDLSDKGKEGWNFSQIFGRKTLHLLRCLYTFDCGIQESCPERIQPANPPTRQPLRHRALESCSRHFKEFMTFDSTFIFFDFFNVSRIKWRNKIKIHQDTCSVLQKFNSRFSKAWHKLRSAMPTSLRGPSDCGPMSSRKHHDATIDLDVRLSTWRV